jgi:hypothetical protein
MLVRNLTQRKVEMTTAMESPIELRRTIQRSNGVEIYEQLQALARKHIEVSDVFTALPYDTNRPEHDLTVVGLAPVPLGVDFVREVLTKAYPQWETIILPRFTARKDLINELVNRIKRDRTPFSLILAHERIEDVAYVMAVLLVALSDHLPYEQLVESFHIVISSIVRTMGAYGVSAVDILRSAGWVHFSFPRTESVRKSGFEADLIRASNRLMRAELEAVDFAIKAVAAPGSVDLVFNLPDRVLKRWPKELRDRHRKVLIQPVTQGTADLIRGYALPVAGAFSGDRDFCEPGRLTYVESLDDVHELMEWIADTRFGAMRIPTYYHREHSLLEKAVSLLRRWQG